MTWPEGITAVLGVIAAAMVAISQHGITTRNKTAPHQDGDQP